MKLIRLGLTFIAVSFLFGCGNQEKKKEIIKLDLVTNEITVSGISSGGYMAHQFHIAYSDHVKGAGLIASGPFGCAENNLQTALSNCLNNKKPINVESYLSKLKELEDKGISSLSNLNNDKVWIYHGTNDTTVSKNVVQAQAKLYAALNTKVAEVYRFSSGHGMPTKNTGVNCESTESPFINNCNFDAVSALLNFINADISESIEIKQNSSALGRIIAFNQSDYLGADDSNTLADTGYYYVPQFCLNAGKCQLHIVFHGCQQNQENIGMKFIEGAGYNRWADKNKTVILYPQTTSSYVPLNPKACWDWWGYTGEEYQTRSGKQMQHVYQMIQGLAKK